MTEERGEENVTVSRKGFCGGGSGKRVMLWHICIMLNLIYITQIIAYVTIV